MDIVGNRKIFYIISGALFAASMLAIALWGLRLGIDFTGGSIVELEFTGMRPDITSLREYIANADFRGVILTPAGERGLFIRTGFLSENDHQKLLSALGGKKGVPTFSEKRFDTIGPTIGRELKTKSIIALILVIVLIVLYIAWAFRKVSRPVPSWKYGVVTIVALVHDVVLPTGFFVLLGRLGGIEIDTLFVTALLTILGFSVHDTIVVFDRIRENLKSMKKSDFFDEVVNRSVKETMTRSINTSLTVLLSLLAVFLFGGESVMFFSLALIVGVIAGTYSSICIASPLLVTWHHWTTKKS